MKHHGIVQPVLPLHLGDGGASHLLGHLRVVLGRHLVAVRALGSSVASALDEKAADLGLVTLREQMMNDDNRQFKRNMPYWSSSSPSIYPIWQQSTTSHSPQSTPCSTVCSAAASTIDPSASVVRTTSPGCPHPPFAAAGTPCQRRCWAHPHCQAQGHSLGPGQEGCSPGREGRPEDIRNQGL